MGPAISELVLALCSRYTSLQSNYSGPKSTYWAMETCYSLKASAAATSVLEEGITRKSIVLPDAPELSEVEGTAAQDMLRSAVQNVLFSWAESTLEPKPFRDDREDFESALAQWGCDCSECQSIRHFFVSPEEDTYSVFAWMHPSKISHVESLLETYFHNFAMCSHDDSWPRLRVSTPSLGSPSLF